MAYVNNVKPALFEAASGCILHRDSESGKVKFLAIGGWRSKGRDSGLKKEEIPYVALSPHLDMVGVRLCADYRDSRAFNGEDLQQKIQRVISLWKGGNFMPLSQRSHSLNTYCLSKIWFKCPSIELRVTELTKILALSRPANKAGTPCLVQIQNSGWTKPHKRKSKSSISPHKNIT